MQFYAFFIFYYILPFCDGSPSRRELELDSSSGITVVVDAVIFGSVKGFIIRFFCFIQIFIITYIFSAIFFEFYYFLYVYIYYIVNI